MPKSWTSIHDQQLLLLILKTHKIDSRLVAQTWSDTYTDDPTTASAITQHIAKLAKKVGGPANSHAAAPKIIAQVKVATPRKTLVPTAKTPTSSARKRPAKVLSDADDDEVDDNDDDEAMTHADESPAKRRHIARLSKTPNKSYRFDESVGENFDDGVTRVKLEDDGADFDGHLDAVVNSMEFDAQSDVSDFNPVV